MLAALPSVFSVYVTTLFTCATILLALNQTFTVEPLVALKRSVLLRNGRKALSRGAVDVAHRREVAEGHVFGLDISGACAL